MYRSFVNNDGCFKKSAYDEIIKPPLIEFAYENTE